MTGAEPSSRQAPQLALGRYRLVERIAAGGMAELYLARVSSVGGFAKKVVVKRMLPELAERDDLRAMFLDEARIAATLQHPNVVSVYDAGDIAGECFIAMEYLDGADLRRVRRELAARGAALPWEHALHIATSVAAGLHYAHEKTDADGEPLDIVHRDVSPHNVFLTRDGGVKLLDFGIAKAAGRQTETVAGTLKGKLAYMSPEQCVGDPIDRRSDVYSLGILLYELTTGRRMYRAKNDYELMREIARGSIERPTSFMSYPVDLEEILFFCLERDPDDRYQSAREVQLALEGFARRHDLILSQLSLAEFLAPFLPPPRHGDGSSAEVPAIEDAGPADVGGAGADSLEVEVEVNLDGGAEAEGASAPETAALDAPRFESLKRPRSPFLWIAAAIALCVAAWLALAS